MSVAHRVRMALRRLGIDVTRFPQPAADYRQARLLAHHRVSVVLDVGANEGQYACHLREDRFKGRIVSFEPLVEPWRRLAERARGDSDWETVRCALGTEDAEITMNVAANAGQSSSVLPMLPAHIEAAPDARYVGTETVTQRRLDDVVPDYLRPGDRTFLKIDVQGYEGSVLGGAPNLLDQVIGVQLEMSLTPLYEGGLLFREALDFLTDRGFELESIEPGFSNSAGRLLQVDGTFFRP